MTAAEGIMYSVCLWSLFWRLVDVGMSQICQAAFFIVCFQSYEWELEYEGQNVYYCYEFVWAEGSIIPCVVARILARM